MKDIAIFGDAFGQGEFTNSHLAYYNNNEKPLNNYYVSHTGLQFYLEQNGYTVDNFCKAGQGNNYNFEKFCRLKQSDPYKYVFFFQTDPLADLKIEDGNCDVSYQNLDFIKNLNDYYNYCDNSLKNLYEKMNCLNTKIYCIGGSYKLHESIHQYNNLIPVVHNLIEMLLPNYKHKIWFHSWGNFLTNNFVDYNLSVVYNSLKFITSDSNYKLYFDEQKHINKKAHKLLYNIIKEKVLCQ